MEEKEENKGGSKQQGGIGCDAVAEGGNPSVEPVRERKGRGWPGHANAFPHRNHYMYVILIVISLSLFLQARRR